MDLDDLKIYNLAMKMGEDVWTMVDTWNSFHKDTIGKQLVKSTDSVAANISEGYGRFHYKDSKNFNYYSRGSLYETKTWLDQSLQSKSTSRISIPNTDERLEQSGENAEQLHQNNWSKGTRRIIW